MKEIVKHGHRWKIAILIVLWILGSFSVTVQAQELAKPEITAIGNLSAGIRFTWNRVEGAEKYEIFRKLYGTGTYQQIDLIPDSASPVYIDQTAENGVTYSYCIKACQGEIRSMASKARSYRFLTMPTLTEARDYYSGVRLTWKKIAKSSGYLIYRKENETDAWKAIGQVKGGSSTACIDKTAEKGKTYSYNLRAYYESATGKIYQSSRTVQGKRNLKSYEKPSTAETVLNKVAESSIRYQLYDTNGMKLNGGVNKAVEGFAVGKSYLYTDYTSNTRDLSKAAVTVKRCNITTGKEEILSVIPAPYGGHGNDMALGTDNTGTANLLITSNRWNNEAPRDGYGRLTRLEMKGGKATQRFYRVKMVDAAGNLVTDAECDGSIMITSTTATGWKLLIRNRNDIYRTEIPFDLPDQGQITAHYAVALDYTAKDLGFTVTQGMTYKNGYIFYGMNTYKDGNLNRNAIAIYKLNEAMGVANLVRIWDFYEESYTKFEIESMDFDPSGTLWFMTNNTGGKDGDSIYRCS